MRGILGAFFLLPSIGFGLGLWALHGLLREMGFASGARRLVLIPCATALLAPTIVPAGTIMTTVVPYGLLLLAGAPPMLHQPALVRFAVGSFAVTGVIVTVLCVLLIRRSGDRPAEDRPSIARAAGFAGVLVALFGTYVLLFVERTLPEHVDAGLIEAEYGHYLDVVARTLDIDDLDAVQDERQRLQEFFEVDPVLIGVSMYDRRLPRDTRGYADIFARPLNVKGYSCSSKPGPHGNNQIVFRCTRGRGTGDLKTIKYRRRFQHRDSWHIVEIEFYRETFLARHPDTAE